MIAPENNSIFSPQSLVLLFTANAVGLVAILCMSDRLEPCVVPTSFFLQLCVQPIHEMIEPNGRDTALDVGYFRDHC